MLKAKKSHAIRNLQVCQLSFMLPVASVFKPSGAAVMQPERGQVNADGKFGVDCENRGQEHVHMPGG